MVGISCKVRLSHLMFKIIILRFSYLQKFNNFPVHLILLSATVPELYEEFLQIHFGRHLSVIRNRVMRKEVGYEVVESSDKNSAVSDLLRLVANHEGTILVYCKTLRLAELLLTPLRNRFESCILFHGQLDNPTKSRIVQDIFDGKHKIVISTLAFGIGVDVPCIKKVFTFGPFDSLMDIVQMAGRAGRKDGAMSKASIFKWNGMFDDDRNAKTPRDNSRLSKFFENELEILKLWFADDENCRLYGISKYLHKEETICKLSGTLFCDVCQNYFGISHSYILSKIPFFNFY